MRSAAHDRAPAGTMIRGRHRPQVKRGARSGLSKHHNAARQRMLLRQHLRAFAPGARRDPPAAPRQSDQPGEAGKQASHHDDETDRPDRHERRSP